MGKHKSKRNVKHIQRNMSEEEMTRKFDQIEERIRRNQLARQLESQCVPITKNVQDPPREQIHYSGCTKFCSFTIDEFIAAIDADALDMTPNMMAGSDVLFGHLQTHVNEFPPRIRLYFRTRDVNNVFALLQHCVEKLYLEESLGVLQGWIIQLGPLFIMGPVELSLNLSLRRLRDALSMIKDVCTEEQQSSLA